MGVRKVDGEKGKEQMRDRNEASFYTSFGLDWVWSYEGLNTFFISFFTFLTFLFTSQRPLS